jgi:serine/threonine-protein kinase
MVTDTGAVKVMDFGIARMMGTEHYTHTGYMMGTPAYMAPEQVLGQEVDRRADLYSVGVLFYRLLTRELPFKADTAIAMAQKQVAEAPTPLGTFRADLPPWCETIISEALAKSPAERFQTAEEFRAAILAAVSPVTLGELPTMATPTAAGLLRTADVSAPQVSGHQSAPSPGVSAATSGSSVERTGTTVILGRGHLLALAAVVGLLVLGMAALGVLALRRGATPPESTTAQPAEPPASVASQPTTPEGGSGQQQPPPPVATVARETPPPAPKAPEAPPPAAKATPQRVKTGTDTPIVPKAKAATERPEAPPPNEPEPTTTPSAAPPAPSLPPLTFKDVKMLVADGETRREREAVLTLTGDHLSLLDTSAQTELLSLPYTSIMQAYFSRSKQPKWIGPDGKETSVSVDLGKMGFFRGDRNWVIVLTKGYPLFFRCEDRELASILRAMEDRTGLKIQR